MRHNHFKGFLVMAFLIWVGVEVDSLEGAESEAAVRKKFQEAYSSGRKKEAFGLLEGSKEKETAQMLYRVITVEKDEGVRAAAFKVLCAMPDKDASLAFTIALCFKAEKDKAVRLQMAQAMTGLEFKWSVLQQLCLEMAKLRYPTIPHPDDYAKATNQQSSSSPQGYEALVKRIEAERKYFEDFLKVINNLAGETFEPSNRSPQDVKKWWQKEQGLLLQKDKVRKDEIEKAAKGK